MPNTYSKLRTGAWGVRADAGVKPGDVVTVTKKSGETCEERIGKIIWTGNGVSLCEIAVNGNAPQQRRKSRYSTDCCQECGTRLERWMDGYAQGLCHDCI